MSITCSIIDAAILNADGTTKPINGIPGFHSGKTGVFHGRYPYSAASKGLTSVYKHLLKYKKDWFPWYDHENPPKIVIVIKNTDTGKKYAYVGSRETAPQSLNGPRVLTGARGRMRVYKWVNRLQPVDLASVGWADD